MEDEPKAEPKMIDPKRSKRELRKKKRAKYL